MKKINKITKFNWYAKISTIVFLISLFTMLTPSFAIENKYTNQLLKLNVEKATGNKVKLTFVTSKPYKIKFGTIKRSDNEYVILLPDTYHSLTSKPDISKVNDLEDIDVKLIPYIGFQNNNGYTRITVKTKSPDVKLSINDEYLNQKPKISNALSNLINKNILKPTPKSTSSNVALPQKNKTTSVTRPQNNINIPAKTGNIINNVAVKKYDNASKTPVNTVTKQQAGSAKQLVLEQKTATNTNAPAPVSKNTTSVTTPVSQNVAVNKASLPVTTKINKPVKHDNSSIKLVLVSLIALLLVFIAVIRYFKSLLMKQMNQAQKKIVSSKNENLPAKPQEPVKSKPVQRSKITKKSVPANNKGKIRLINSFDVDENRGIYLIQTKYNIILIGTINSEVFLLKEFSNINDPQLFVRKEKSLKTKDVYYVQVNNWRSLISVTRTAIKLELVLDETLVSN